MKAEKIVYIPEVVYTPEDKKTRKSNSKSRAAAVAAASMLALAAQASDNVEVNKLDSVSFPKTNVTQVVLSKPADIDTYTIHKNGKAINIVEMPDGSFVRVEDKDKFKRMNINPIALIFTLSGFALLFANLLSIQSYSNKRISELSAENAKLRHDYDDFKESHPGLGVTTPRKMRELRRKVLAHDYSVRGDIK